MTEREFAEIVNDTKGIVLSAIETHLSNHFSHAIDDVVQETYLRAYRSLVNNTFRDDSKLSTWLYTIAKNECFRMNKKLSREEIKFQKSVEMMRLGEQRGSEYSTDRELLRELIIQLPEKYRSVMELISLGFSEKAIAEKLNLKRGTVKSRASRGREMLQRIIQGGDYERREV